MLVAVRDQLRSVCGFTDFECDCHNDPQPHPTSGRRFIAVYPGECRGGPHSDSGIHEWIGINVGITMRFSGTPQDYISNELYLKALTGMETLQRQVQLAIHANYTVMAAANTIIATVNDIAYSAGPPVVPAFTTDKFITPLEWQYTTPVPDVKLGDWFFSDNENEISKKCGLFVDVRFSGAHRPQQLSKMR
jgi:hypothetical protein